MKAHSSADTVYVLHLTRSCTPKYAPSSSVTCRLSEPRLYFLTFFETIILTVIAYYILGLVHFLIDRLLFCVFRACQKASNTIKLVHEM